MKYYSLSEQPRRLTDGAYLSMARGYWGEAPLPDGAEIIGGFSDRNRAGALIRLASGNCVCGNAGAISNIPQEG